MNWVFITFICTMFLAGLFIGRWNGGGTPSWLKWLDNPFSQILYAYPYIWLAFLAVPAMIPDADLNLLITHILWLSVLTVIMILKGHGHNMDLGYSDKSHPDSEFEWYEYIISGLYGKIPNYWYDALGLAISGMTYTLPLGVYMANPFIIWSGALKAPCYMIARVLWNKWPDKFRSKTIFMDGPTAWGEAFTCATLHASAGVVLFALLGLK